MKVRVFGIEFTCGSGISVADFFEHMSKSKTHGIDFNGYARYLYLKKHDDCYVGLFVTTKDHKKFMEMSGVGGNVEIVARDVTEGAALADFNFFIVHAVTGRGLYQHYHQSCTFTQFGSFTKKYYDSLKAKLIAEATKDVTNKKEQGKIRQRYKPPLTWSYFFRKESFDSLIEKLSRIKSFSFGISTINATEPVFTPLGGISKSVRQTYSFSKDAKLASILPAIRSALKSVSIDDASVDGVDDKDEAITIHLESNLDPLAEYDFDDVANRMAKFNPAIFEKSWMTTELIRIFKSKGSLFTSATRG
ncbi:hypothetical protein [Limnohabitans sp.]|uniref:hypothetical protein n=1 Tax=Limnohabitans sp. TaxID=1907725 RepID=UPI0025BE14E8|nr:hypothetical protein [Limnohabitans sp.]